VHSGISLLALVDLVIDALDLVKGLRKIPVIDVIARSVGDKLFQQKLVARKTLNYISEKGQK